MKILAAKNDTQEIRGELQKQNCIQRRGSAEVRSYEESALEIGNRVFRAKIKAENARQFASSR